MPTLPLSLPAPEQFSTISPRLRGRSNVRSSSLVSRCAPLSAPATCHVANAKQFGWSGCRLRVALDQQRLFGSLGHAIFATR
jgi:hypothetical protein